MTQPAPTSDEELIAQLRARVQQLEDTLVFITALLNLHHPEIIARAAEVSVDTVRRMRQEYDGHHS